MATFSKKILITGGAGFIGSHVVRRFVTRYPHYRVFNLDKLTYAGNLENLRDVEHASNYQFVKGDITDEKMMDDVFAKENFDAVIHLAAESHVDRSILHPGDFILTNILGTVNLLNASRKHWKNLEEKLFYHISTDEVFGSLDQGGYFKEKSFYDPHSPYSASKASSDHMVRSFGHTFGLPYLITNCSNNYGPFQFPEKLIPLAINNIKNNKPVPVYSQGENVRDWVYVEDHASAIDTVFHSNKRQDTFCIGGFNEWKNLDLIHLMCKIMNEKLKRESGASEELITFVKDRAGHDLRYAIDATRIMNELGWKPSLTFEEGLSKTIDWYLSNDEWLTHVTSGAYQKYYEQQYVHR